MDFMWLQTLPTSSNVAIIMAVLFASTSNTAYEFKCCYFHGCPICFEPDQIVPQRKHIYKDKNTGAEKYADVCMGDLVLWITVVLPPLPNLMLCSIGSNLCQILFL